MNNSKAMMFVSRLPAGHPVHLADLIPTAFGVIDTFREKVATIRRDPTLSRIGASAQIEKALAAPVGHLKQMRADVEKQLAAATNQRTVLRDRVTKAENHPAELKREVRQYLREMPQTERLKAASAPDDPLVREAVIGAPHYLSGLPRELWQGAVDSAVEEKFGEALAQISVLERSYEEARAALQVAADDLRRESGFEAKDFERLAA